MRLPFGPRAVARAGRATGGLAVALVVCAIAVAVEPVPSLPAWIRAAFALALVAVAGVVHHVVGRRSRAPLGWLSVDEGGVRRVDRNGAVTLVDWKQPFGLVVFASPDRARLLLALTSPGAMRYVSARVQDASDAAGASGLLDRATTAAESDLRADEHALSAADAEQLLDYVARRSPAAVDRAYLSDASGEAIVLDRGELRVGARRIDLLAPLEWRASFFQELGAQVASVCQATWVRQGDVEVVFVAPMPGDRAWSPEADPAVRAAGKGAVVQRSVARDVRLMQASAGEPPPRELRRAIDRVFMLPLRHALDRAPRVARAPSPPARPMPEGRA